jgi:hypothetical protein
MDSITFPAKIECYYCLDYSNCKDELPNNPDFVCHGFIHFLKPLEDTLHAHGIDIDLQVRP